MTTGVWCVAIVLLSALVISSPAGAQDFERSARAYRGGDFASALSHWRALAQRGHVQAQYQLGVIYEYGRGVRADDRQAVAWYHKAAQQGSAAAQYRLAVLHDNGWGIPRDDAKAVHWYRRAAVQGHTLAQHDLAFMYWAGRGVNKDKVQTYMWLSIAVGGGSVLMGKHLRRVAAAMTPAEIAEAERLARDWVNAQPR